MVFSLIFIQNYKLIYDNKIKFNKINYGLCIASFAEKIYICK